MKGFYNGLKMILILHHPERGKLLEEFVLLLTDGMSEHPEDYDGPCNCDLCKSYVENDA